MIFFYYGNLTILKKEKYYALYKSSQVYYILEFKFDDSFYTFKFQWYEIVIKKTSNLCSRKIDFKSIWTPSQCIMSQVSAPIDFLT